jgi:tetratricopeptide (TPR) repeat protein
MTPRWRGGRAIVAGFLLLVAAPGAAQLSAGRHDADLAALDASLARGDAEATRALLGRLQPALDADERFALDAIYVFLGRRRVSEAKEQWNRLAPKLQESLRGPAGPASPEEEAKRQRRAAEAVFVQGLLTAQAGEKEEALRLLRQADGWGFPPLDSPLMRLAAESLAGLQEPALAAQAYREVLKRSPRDVAARLGLGASLLASGLVAAAKGELEEVLRQRPEEPEAHSLLGAALLEEKRIDEARAHLERALAADPRCVSCLARLAQVAYLAGDDARCASWLAKATALDPAHVETNLVLGMLENRKGLYDRAIEHLSRVVEQVPGSARAQYQLALAWRRSGNAAKAREHQQIYDRLIQEQRAKGLGVRGAEE